MRKRLVKGCIIFMLFCLSGCGQTDGADAKGTEGKNQPATVSDQLSDDLFSFQIQVGEDIFTIPSATYQDFAEKGYHDKALDFGQLEPGHYVSDQELVNGDTTLFLDITNLTEETQIVKNCPVTAILADYDLMFGKNPAAVFLPKGIQLGVSGKEDVIAAYGEPSDIFKRIDDQNYSILYYTQDSSHEVRIMIDGETNAISRICLVNQPQ